MGLLAMSSVILMQLELEDRCQKVRESRLPPASPLARAFSLLAWSPLKDPLLNTVPSATPGFGKEHVQSCMVLVVYSTAVSG